jgi:nicotinamide mononucleotide (NMN) deamidase PncC
MANRQSLGEVSAAAAVTMLRPARKGASADAGAGTTGRGSRISVEKRS